MEGGREGSVEEGGRLKCGGREGVWRKGEG